MEADPMTKTVTEPRVCVSHATSPADKAAVKDIFRAFIEFLPIELDFQGIDDEMARFPNDYVLMLIAKLDGVPAGAVALKEHTPEVCEMKRLYVLPNAQGTGAGRLLCEALLTEAKKLGYNTMLLDSLKRLEAAVALYHKLGFTQTEPYNFNPEGDVIYMKRDLA
jgi:GNAT superfamily N-acetyltransferase